MEMDDMDGLHGGMDGMDDMDGMEGYGEESQGLVRYENLKFAL